MIRLLSSLLCIVSVFCFASLSAAAASFGVPAQTETQIEGEESPDLEIGEQVGTDIPDTQEGEILDPESGDPITPEEIPMDGIENPQPSDGSVSEKVDPFEESGILNDLIVPVVDDSSVDLLSIPSTSPIGGYYTEVTSSLGSGNLFVPSEFAHDYLTFDGSGKMVCLANSVVNALLVTDSEVIQVRFLPMSYPQHYYQVDDLTWMWVDFSITSAQDGNVQVMQQFDQLWISDKIFEACILLIGGILVCRLFMTK